MAQATSTKTVAVKASGTAKTGRAPSKQEQTETAVKLTKAQQTKLETLISAVKDGVARYLELDKVADAAKHDATVVKVLTARAVALLADHPAMVATRGPKAGEPAITKLAQATGYAPTTLTPLYHAAMNLRKQGWHKRTADPTEDEIQLVSGHVKSEAEARAERRAKQAKQGKGKGQGGTRGSGDKVTFSTLQGQLKALREAADKFTATSGFTQEQADDLVAGLDELHDVIESATVKATAAA